MRDGTEASYLTTSAAARRLGIGRGILTRATHRGEIRPAYRTAGGAPRFHPADIDAFAARLAYLQYSLEGSRPTARCEGGEERTYAEKLVAVGEARFRALIERSSDLVRVLAPDTTLLYASPSHLRILGYAPEELLARRSTLFIHPDDRRMAQDAFDSVVTQGGERQVILRMRHAEGGYRTLEAILQNRLADPAVRGIVVNSRDVTEREVAISALRASDERYRQVERHAPIGLALVAPDGRWLRVNPALCALVGYSEEELLTRTFQEITHPDHLDADLALVRQMLDGEITTYQVEKRYIRKQGDQVWVLLSVSLVRDEAETPLYFISQIQDISERKRAEEALETARRAAGKRAAAFAVLLELSIAFAAEREPYALCWLAVAQLVERFGYDLASIYMRDGDILRLRAQLGYDTIFDPLPIQGQGITARAMRTGAMQFVPDVAGDSEYLAGTSGIVSEICVPILVGGRPEGVLNVESRTPGVLDDEACELIEMVALQLAISLENVALRGKEGRRADRLAALQAVTTALAAARNPSAVGQIVVEGGRAALGAAAAVVRLISTDGAALDLVAAMGYGVEDYGVRSHLPVSGDHPVCQVARSGRPIWSHVQEEFQAYFSQGNTSWHVASNLQGAAMLPLIVDGRTIGVLGLSFATPQSFDQADQDSLLTLANATAQALERARLDAAEHERARIAEELAQVRAAQAAQAEAMATIGVALSGTLEPEQLYTLILAQAVRLVPSDQAEVLLYEHGWATVAATWGTPALPIGTRIFPIAGPDRPWMPPDRPGAVYLADTDTDPDWVAYPPFVGAQRIRSILSAPLVIDGVVVGTLNMHSSMPGYYEEQHLPLATAFAERVCHALRNARLYRAERERRLAAEALAQMRNDFLGAVSHELRTPLTAMVGFADLLRDRWSTMGEAQRQGYLDWIVTSANRQRRLVEDLLETSRVEAGMLQCARATVPLRPLLERAVSEVQALYRGQHIELDGADDILFEGDADRTLQVVINLVDNAAKYSPEGSPVAVRWNRAADKVAVRVRDHGPGIPEASRAALFTRFGRLPGARARAGRTGTGLGLYLSRLLAEAMAGDLTLESSGPDGSIFLLHLPAPSASTGQV